MKKETQDLFNKIIQAEHDRIPQKGGFFPLPKFPDKKLEEDTCNSTEHDPPKYLHIPQGQGYKHVCPRCGKVQVVIPPQITL